MRSNVFSYAQRLCSVGLLSVCASRSWAQTELTLKQGSPDVVALATKAVLTAVLCLGALAGILYLWRQRSLMRGTMVSKSAIDVPVVEWGKRVSSRTSLVLIQWNGKRYLLAESANAIQLIDSSSIESSAP